AVRTAIHRPGFVGRPDHAARSGVPDTPVRRSGPSAQRRSRAQYAGFGSLGDRTPDRQRAGTGCRPGGRADDSGEDPITPLAATKQQRLGHPQNHYHQTWAPSAARSRRAAPPLVINDATIVPAATTAIMIVHTALISGLTPSRTSE